MSETRSSAPVIEADDGEEASSERGYVYSANYLESLNAQNVMAEVVHRVHDQGVREDDYERFDEVFQRTLQEERDRYDERFKGAHVSPWDKERFDRLLIGAAADEVLYPEYEDPSGDLFVKVPQRIVESARARLAQEAGRGADPAPVTEGASVSTDELLSAIDEELQPSSRPAQKEFYSAREIIELIDEELGTQTPDLDSLERESRLQDIRERVKAGFERVAARFNRASDAASAEGDQERRRSSRIQRAAIGVVSLALAGASFIALHDKEEASSAESVPVPPREQIDTAPQPEADEEAQAPEAVSPEASPEAVAFPDDIESGDGVTNTIQQYFAAEGVQLDADQLGRLWGGLTEEYSDEEIAAMFPGSETGGEWGVQYPRTGKGGISGEGIDVLHKLKKRYGF